MRGLLKKKEINSPEVNKTIITIGSKVEINVFIVPLMILQLDKGNL